MEAITAESRREPLCMLYFHCIAVFNVLMSWQHLDVISSAGIVPQTSEPSLPDENGGILPATLAAPSFNLDQPSGSNSLIGIPTAPGISHTSVDSGSVFSFGSATLWDRASNLVSSMVKGQQNSSAVYSGS